MMYAYVDQEEFVEKIITNPLNVEIDRYNVVEDLRMLTREGMAHMGIYPVLEAENKDMIHPAALKLRYVFDRAEKVVKEILEEQEIDIEAVKSDLIKSLAFQYINELSKTNVDVLFSIETKEPLSEKVLQERAMIRKRHKELENQINAAQTVSDLMNIDLKI